MSGSQCNATAAYTLQETPRIVCFCLLTYLLIVALWLRQVVDIHRQSKKESPLFLGITLANVDRF